MQYSVWDPLLKRYDYYQAPTKKSDIEPPTPNHLKTVKKSPVGLGSAVAWPLPSDAVKIGSGALARGSIAQTESSAGGLGDFLGVSLSLPVLLVGAVAAWYLLK